MLHSILDFLMDLSLIYLLTAMFVILDLLLLSMRVRRLRNEKKHIDPRELRRDEDARQQRQAFEKRQAYVRAAG